MRREGVCRFWMLFDLLILERGLLIGPEGGFANEELDQVDKLGNVCRVSLGNQILRSDTVGGGLACWQAVAGDWR